MRRNDNPISTQRLLDAGASYRVRMLLWEAFPASFDDEFLSLSRLDPGDLRNTPTATELKALHLATQKYPRSTSEDHLAMLEWRFVHAIVVGDHEEMIVALSAWSEIMENHPARETAPMWLHFPIRRMLERIAALGTEAPPEAIDIMNELLDSHLEAYDPAQYPRRIDGLFRSEYQRAIDAETGSGFFGVFLDGAVERSKKAVLLPLLRKHMERLALAILRQDVDGFIAAHDDLSRICRTLDFSFQSYLHNWALFADRDEPSGFMTLEKKRIHAKQAMREWLEGGTFKESLLFYQLVLEAMEHRRLHGQWPAEGELETRDAEPTRQGILTIPGGTVFLSHPRSQAINSALGAYAKGMGTLPETIEEFLPHLPDDLIPAATARFVEAEPRPMFYRSSPDLIVNGVDGSALIFVPITFSEEFRRFLRGEDVSP